MTKSIFLICLLFMFSVRLVAADTNENKCLGTSHFGDSCPLKALRELKDNPPEPLEVETVSGTYTFSSQDLIADTESILRSILGDEKTAQITGDWRNSDVNVNIEIPDNIQTFDAISKITELAKDKRVVMINESHHVSLHRIFALELAKVLKKVGYTHIAAETFGRNISKLNERGYPTLNDGTYIIDPEFGHFIRTAASLGYGFVRYESGKFDRELGQAENLASFIENNPNAKLLVYAGYGHIREATLDENDVRMGQHFQELTKIDPLTIDQSEGTS